MCGIAEYLEDFRNLQLIQGKLNNLDTYLLEV